MTISTNPIKGIILLIKKSKWKLLRSLLLFHLDLLKKLWKNQNFTRKYISNQRKNANIKNRHLYAQALTSKVNEILKLKEKISNLSNKKIKSIHNTINNSRKIKLRINLTTKEPS